VAKTVAWARPDCTLFFAESSLCGNFWALEKEQRLNSRLTAIMALSRVCKYEAGAILDRLMALSWAKNSLGSWKIDQGG